MLELVVLVCLVDEPSRCKDVNLTLIEDATPMQCMMGAQPEIAKWIADHPRWTAKRWTCQPAGTFAKI